MVSFQRYYFAALMYSQSQSVEAISKKESSPWFASSEINDI